MFLTTETQNVQVGILRSYAVTLQYEGTCTWTIEVTVEGNSDEIKIGEGHEGMIGHMVIKRKTEE